ncbi:MAG TPA: hypothetical protein PKD20_01015 [Candidatus Saccharibacteria bacterium]|nr:hypothetical protein [Candidatus Saccharibacteria bacterium]
MFKKRGGQQGFALEFVLIGVVLLAVIGAGYYFFIVAGPKQKVNKAANEYVKQSVAGEYDDALKLTTADDDEEDAVKKFSEGIDDGVGKDDYKISSTSIDGDSATVKFIVDDDEDKTIKLDLERKDGEWLISGVVYSLGDVKNEEESSSSSDTETTTVETPAANSCLPAAALDKFWRYTSGWQFYFQADSNELEYSESVAVDSIKQMKTFYDDNKQYNFAFVIDVTLYLANGSASDVQLAKDRAGVVAYNMNLGGIPYEYIRFGEATSAGIAEAPENATGSRAAWVSINSSCDALSQPQDFTADNVGR